MKKLILLVILWVPFTLFGQLLDTTAVFYEDFEGGVLKVSTSYTNSLGGTGGDWRIDSTLYASPQHSFHTPVYTVSGDASATTLPIPLTGSGTAEVNHVYLSLDHICKVYQGDNAAIWYSTSSSADDEGNLIWGTWKRLSFKTSSDFYYGTGDFLAGKFNDECYPGWKPGNMNAVPANTWWRNEYWDITRFVLTEGVTHFRLQFRCNRVSPQNSGSEGYAGWYIDNILLVLSNCELIKPSIALTPPVYAGANNNTLNNIGPYNITAKITDNDTVNVNSLLFTYSINGGPAETVANDITSNTFGDDGNTVKGRWTLPAICYGDTIRYHIYAEDSHGSSQSLDTFLTAHHNYTNIHDNDCRLDSLNSFPYCLITGQSEDVTVYFTNRSDNAHSISTGDNYQTALSVTLKVENGSHTVTHNSTHEWSGSLCFDEPASLSLGSFQPTHGFNYVTVCINSRNGHADGWHANDTLRYTGFACDSLLHGDYTVGGSQPDFADMEDVKASLLYCGIDGPVTFHLRPGTYGDFNLEQNYVGQSDTNTITFAGDDVNSVIITNNHDDAGSNIFGAVTLSKVSNYRFKDLTIRGKSVNISRAVVLRGGGCTGIVFDGCHIEAHPTNSNAFTSCGISRPTAATGNPDEAVIRNCSITGGNYGIYYIGTNAQQNRLVIENCTLNNCFQGIYTKYSNPEIKNCRISQYGEDLTTHQNFTGIYAERTVGIDINGNTIGDVFKADYGICLKYATGEDFHIRNNKVNLGNCAHGVYVSNSSSSSTGSSPMTGRICNNEVILCPAAPQTSYAMQIENSNFLHVTNNSLFIKSDAPCAKTAALFIKNNSTTYLDNNLLINHCNSQDGSDYPVLLNSTSTIDGDYNDLVSLSGVVGSRQGIARNSIAEWEDAIGTTLHNISLLPLMADPTESLLPLDFIGLECAADPDVTTDIRGIGRTALTYIGAYANPIEATDAAVVAMTSPALGNCPQNVYDIKVNIANRGSEALDFSRHQMTLTVISEALGLHHTSSVNSTTIPLFGSSEQTVAANVAVPVNQSVDFTFIASTQGDNNRLNDTLRLTFVMEAAIPDFEEDFSGGTRQVWTVQQLAGAGNWSFQEGTGTDPSLAPVYGTGRLFFNSAVFSNTTKSRAVMPVVVLTDAVNPILEMWMSQDKSHSGANYSNLEGVTVNVSADGGTTFTPIVPQGQTSALAKRYNAQAPADGQWTLFTYDLSDYTDDGCILIAFDAQSRQGSNINIDRIRLRNLFDNDIAVTNIYAQGETPLTGARDVVGARIRNEGRQDQSGVVVHLNVDGPSEDYTGSVTIASLPAGQETVVVFPDHDYQVQEVKNVEVRAADDQNNINNALNWRMETTRGTVIFADTGAAALVTGNTESIIRPCVRYKLSREMAVTDVKYYYHAGGYIENPEDGFRAFVADTNGVILATSGPTAFSTLLDNSWNTIPISNFAVTNTDKEVYVGIEMLARGEYLCSQIETPIRDSAFFYLESDGTYTPQTFGRFMIGAVIDTPFTRDFALLELASPSGGCDLGEEPVQVHVANNGRHDILPGITLSYSVNNGPAVSQTFTDTLRSHDDAWYTFADGFDFTNHQIDIDNAYLIKVWATAVDGDRLPYNDTLSAEVVSMGKSPQPTVTSPVNVNYHTSGVLSPQLPPSIGQGLFGWYTLTGTGNWDFHGYSDHFTTPTIFFDTTYYVTAVPGYIHDTVVGNGTTSSSEPFFFTTGYSRGRILYRQDEIGNYGTLTNIGVFVKSVANGEDGIPIRIYLKETDMDELPIQAECHWDEEKTGAQLVVEQRVFFGSAGWHYLTLSAPFEYTQGNLLVLTETNCKDSCSGTGNQCNNCGNYVSGGTRYPKFQSTNIDNGYVQYRKGNDLNALSGNYTNFKRRINMSFSIANIECQSEKVPVRIHVPDIPSYDVQTDSLLAPTGGCTMGDEYCIVKVTNLLNTPVPAGKVTVHAVFNGSEITQTIHEAFAGEEAKYVTFETPFDFSAPDSNITFNYTVYTTMNNETVVYRTNDTITGSFVSKYTYAVPAAIDYTGGYTETFTVMPTGLSTHYFYENEFDETPFRTGTSWTTEPLYDTLTLWVSGKTVPGNCETERIRVNINVATPQYDLITNGLVYPSSFLCGTEIAPLLQVSVGNTDTSSSSVIPAGAFKLTAGFTGTNAASGVSVITVPLRSLHDTAVTFATGIDIGSHTQNNSYDYVIYSDPVDAGAAVYRANDTIRGRLFIPATPLAPPAMDENAAYGSTPAITPVSSILDYFYFYRSNDPAETAFAEGASFVTEPLYADNTTYYYSGRIEDDDFDTTFFAGNENSAQQIPFDFSKKHSMGVILYSANEIGAIAGRIDSFYIDVKTANNGGNAIPVKFWLKNAEDAQRFSGQQQHDWADMTAGALPVFDGELGFDQEGPLGIRVPGGFDYEGNGLYLLTEHEFAESGGAGNNGINPAPQFRSTKSTKKVLTKSGNGALDGVQTFQIKDYRPNTQFKFNYTCESPRSPIRITTAVPGVDVGVVSVEKPLTHNNAYTQTETVKVTVKNFGREPASGIPVYYRLADGTPVMESHEGTIASGATATVSFSTPVDLTPVYFATPFKAYTGLQDDGCHSNDTVSMTVGKEDPCISRPLNNAEGADISNVAVSNLDNGPGMPFTGYDPAPGDGLYTDYTESVAPALLVQGQTYPLTVTHSYTTTTTPQVYKRVYIDYNRDGDFDDDGERVFKSEAINGGEASAATTALITVPQTTSLGLTRMRVICVAKNFNEPCGTYPSTGETEDYAVALRPPFDTDLGIAEIIHPVGEVCPDSHGKIRVAVKNFGRRPVSFSGPEPLTLTATVTGPTPGIYTAALQSGSIGIGETTVMTIDDVDFHAAGIYRFHYALSYAGDEYAFNDTMSVAATVAGTVAELPFNDDFDHNTGTTELHFTPDWTVESSALNYRWKIQEGKSPDTSHAGPSNDHTYAGTSQSTLGRYATVIGSTGSYNTSNPAWTTITTGCLNLHYSDGYPAEINFYKHFFGTGTANFEMTVEVGSGKDFIPVDTLTKSDGGQTHSHDLWNKHNTTLIGYDEVGRLRFKVTKHKYRINPSIDDLNVDNSKPDLAVVGFEYPYSYLDPEHPECLPPDTTFKPRIIIANRGNTPVHEFNVLCKLKTGQTVNTQTITGHVNADLLPGDELTYEFEDSLRVPNHGRKIEVYGLVDIEFDKNGDNDSLRIISCTSTGIDDYETPEGVTLFQNVPNPADGKTRIAYWVPASGTAVVGIYSAAGQLLYSRVQEAAEGENHIDVNTVRFAPGVYYYTLSFENELLTKKMIIQ